MNALSTVRAVITLAIVVSIAFMVGIWWALLGGLVGYFLTRYLQSKLYTPYRKVTLWYIREPNGSLCYHHLERGHIEKSEPYTNGSDIHGSWVRKYGLRYKESRQIMVIPETKN